MQDIFVGRTLVRGVSCHLYLNHTLFIFEWLLILFHLVSTSSEMSIQIKFDTEIWFFTEMKMFIAPLRKHVHKFYNISKKCLNYGYSLNTLYFFFSRFTCMKKIQLSCIHKPLHFNQYLQTPPLLSRPSLGSRCRTADELLSELFASLIPCYGLGDWNEKVNKAENCTKIYR